MTEQDFLFSNFEEKIRAAVRPADPQPEVLERILFDVKKAVSRLEPVQPLHRRRNIYMAAFSALLLLIVVVILVISPQKVLAEVRKIFSVFVPGFGFVDEESSVRMILKPVRLERNGSWDTIEQAFTDSNQTLIVPGDRYYIGPDNKGCVQHSAHKPYLTMESPSLGRLRFDQTSISGGLVFPPVPADVDDVTLFLDWQWPCVDEPDWEFPLHFEAAPEGTLIPVIAVDQITQEPSPTPPLSDTPAGENEKTEKPEAKPELTLVTVVETAAGYIFGGNLTWQENSIGPQRYELPMTDEMQLADANQKVLVLENTNPNDLQLNAEEPKPNSTRWAYQVAGKDLSSPLTLTIPYLVKFVDNHDEKMKFDLDFGVQPQSGLAWGADQVFNLDGKQFKLIKVEYNTSPDYQEVKFSFMVDEGIQSIYVSPSCPSQSTDPMAGGGGSSGTLEIKDGLLTGYASLPEVPTGVCTFSISGIEYRKSGPWLASIPLPGK